MSTELQKKESKVRANRSVERRGEREWRRRDVAGLGFRGVWESGNHVYWGQCYRRAAAGFENQQFVGLRGRRSTVNRARGM